ncbi:hypothetical protein ACVWW1_008884 [Bradyrhizobium sp. JR3.5]
MFVVLLVMAPPSQELEPPAIPGRFKAYLYTIQYDHCLEALDVAVFIEEAPRELLVLLHGRRGNVQDEVGIARDVEAIDDVGG